LLLPLRLPSENAVAIGTEMSLTCQLENALGLATFGEGAVFIKRILEQLEPITVSPRLLHHTHPAAPQVPFAIE
jgi:hypothetical protein